MLIDTHCHLQLGQYEGEIDTILDECLRENVALVMPGCDFESSKRAVEIAEGREGGVWAAIGIHPTDTAESFDVDAFRELTSSKKVVAIGECGLDYFHIGKEDNRDEVIRMQKDTFLAQADLAHELGLPLVIHCRDAHADMIELLVHHHGADSFDSERERGILHCFTGSHDDARSYVDLGYMISFTGIITFTDEYDEMLRALPLEKLLIETDSPYLTPVPYRGKRNSPLYVEYVARKIAEVRGISYEEVVEATWQNAKRVFGIDLK